MGQLMSADWGYFPNLHGPPDVGWEHIFQGCEISSSCMLSILNGLFDQ